VVNPGDHADFVGTVVEADAGVAARAVRHAATAAAVWAATPVEARAACLERAADGMQADMADLMGLAMREAGKSAANAIAEVREAIDFLRYYAAEARRGLAGTRPLGPVVCISPWNFPLAIFTGQVAAALAAGNPVLAKPAEETPLMAAEAVRILHEAGVPADVLQLLTGDGDVGAALVVAPETAGVLFTGSTEVARLIQRQLAGRVAADARPIPLVAETGGQNALIVDSSALAEQVVGDVLASAFDSAGQRCSALRVLCLQEEVAERILAMLKGALAELALGRTDKLAVDVGPVISAEARTTIEAHVAKLAARGKRVERRPLPDGTEAGSFVAPTIIEIGNINELEREVFGPVLHVLRFRRDELERTVDAVNATGYGLTFGLHTRLDDTVARVAARIRAGNLYVNRNIIGAVVGVQPFGGRGLSGTGPKAGGPLYLGRLVQAPPPVPAGETGPADPAALALADWLAARGADADAAAVQVAIAASRVGTERELPGPVGERNLYALRPRGRILLVPETKTGLWRQLGAALAAGNVAVVDAGAKLDAALADLPAAVAGRLGRTADWAADGPFAGALIEGDAARVRRICGRIADLPGPVLIVQAGGADGAYCLDWLVEEVSTSINTAAAGGNASLMAIG
jgi:RHH-type proline utilization regulon transcriptional repressor/proline dehydrogenase/delta 1-pyrroline-5-carboxylate dehydrogenase